MNPKDEINLATAAVSEGGASRQRLLQAALRCFAEHGFEKTSTRMIAQAAQANVAAIRYYFGDKAGIYRAAFVEPMGQPQGDIALFNDPRLSLEQALQGLYSGFIEPLKQGELVQLCTKLHMREMVEPTGLWQQEIDHGIAPYHRALVKVLSRHLGITNEDDDVHRLALCILAQAVFLYVGRDVMQAVRPGLVNNTVALDIMSTRLTEYALALFKTEQERRARSRLRRKNP
jgi:TetR/AcrR family transcriptional regulator, regulator of cefoperazone and chloramphenicol sensitivity